MLLFLYNTKERLYPMERKARSIFKHLFLYNVLNNSVVLHLFILIVYWKVIMSSCTHLASHLFWGQKIRKLIVTLCHFVS